MGIENSENNCLITKAFLETILKRKIADFKTSEGSNPGDNFLTILIAIEVKLVDEEEPLHLLFKTFPAHPTRQKLLEDTNIFLKEFLVYDVLIPELIDFQKEIIGIEKVLQPALPQVCGGAAVDYENEELNLDADPMLKNFLLMVDVRKTLGFQMADKLQSLGYHHVKVVLTELAKLHALNYAYKKHKSLPSLRSLFAFLHDPFFCNLRQKPTIDGMSSVNIKIVTDVLHDYLDGRPEFANTLKEFAQPGKIFEYFNTFLNPEGMEEEKVEALMRVKPTENKEGLPLKEQWITGGHGDCWTNNMLFKKDDTGKVTDTILVDLQLARESCIMADIVYFIYTSTDTDFRSKYLEEMLAYYFTKFVDFCKILKVEPWHGFTLANFKRKFHRSKIFGFLFAIIVLPIILQKPETAIDMDSINIHGDDEEEADGLAAMFKKVSGRDDEEEKLLRNRFISLFEELYDEGVL